MVKDTSLTALTILRLRPVIRDSIEGERSNSLERFSTTTSASDFSSADTAPLAAAAAKRGFCALIEGMASISFCV